MGRSRRPLPLGGGPGAYPGLAGHRWLVRVQLPPTTMEAPSPRGTGPDGVGTGGCARPCARQMEAPSPSGTGPERHRHMYGAGLGAAAGAVGPCAAAPVTHQISDKYALHIALCAVTRAGGLLSAAPGPFTVLAPRLRWSGCLCGIAPSGPSRMWEPQWCQGACTGHRGRGRAQHRSRRVMRSHLRGVRVALLPRPARQTSLRAASALTKGLVLL